MCLLKVLSRRDVKFLISYSCDSEDGLYSDQAVQEREGVLRADETITRARRIEADVHRPGVFAQVIEKLFVRAVVAQGQAEFRRRPALRQT
jgi:hypothetical protein